MTEMSKRSRLAVIAFVLMVLVPLLASCVPSYTPPS